MKVERQAGLHVNARQTVAPATSWGAAGTQRSFESALRDQRQRVTPNDQGGRQRPEARSSGSRSSATAERSQGERPATRITAERATSPVDRRQTPASPPAPEDLPLAPYVDRALAGRWRRAAGTQGESCIEVVHAASNSRFLLSREDGIWLLAIQSRGSPGEDDAIVQALREQFAQRGLGALDVIKL
jgi:hypothetical protein